MLSFKQHCFAVYLCGMTRICVAKIAFSDHLYKKSNEIPLVCRQIFMESHQARHRNGGRRASGMMLLPMSGSREMTASMK
jgi:hypothetical protein